MDDGQPGDDALMALAIAEAEGALAHDDVPVGAVVVRAGEVVGRGRNRREVDLDPTGHAEVVALRDAARALGNWYLAGCELVVTLEPCAMCAGAISLARIDRVVFGAWDAKAGVLGSTRDAYAEPGLIHRPSVAPGVQAARCGALLTAFFADRRAGRAPGRRARDGSG